MITKKMAYILSFFVAFVFVLGLSKSNGQVYLNTYPLFQRCLSGSGTFRFLVKSCFEVNVTLYDGLYNPVYRFGLNFETEGFMDFTVYTRTQYNWTSSGNIGIPFEACKQFLNLEVSWLSNTLRFALGNTSLSYSARMRENNFLYMSVSSGQAKQGSLVYYLQNTGSTIYGMFSNLTGLPYLMCPLVECGYLGDTTLNSCQLSYSVISPVCRNDYVYLPYTICSALQETCDTAELAVFVCLAPINVLTCGRCDVKDVSDQIKTMCLGNHDQTGIIIARMNSCSYISDRWSSYYFISYIEGKSNGTTPTPTTFSPPLRASTFLTDSTVTSTKTSVTINKETNTLIILIVIIVVAVFLFVITAVIVSCFKRSMQKRNVPRTNVYENRDVDVHRPPRCIPLQPQLDSHVRMGDQSLGQQQDSHSETTRYENGGVELQQPKMYIPLQPQGDSHSYDRLGDRSQGASQNEHLAENLQNYTKLKTRREDHKYDLIGQRDVEQRQGSTVYDYVIESNISNISRDNNTSNTTVHDYLELQNKRMR